ncbi:hypothetical protein CERZMDRAFT_100499 [Cercospora zeae-maydis SCOH1-5]|uniref:1-alkyl-2-acetylglycerophosphocholine esterase n=1 Tax=Cercospora zeae-maydis SCOH1-5 TaxID=717836 RepID=A0A6A6F5V2_9PEZI|nr:hypothetical protein CERZMDRAFT_100499 [Cercospora zeae-maydis SCOH1-5]
MSTVLPPDHPRLGAEQASRPPRAKRAKWRAPRGLRDSSWVPSKTLPLYTGPYPVGTMEIDLPAAKPQAFSQITRHMRHILQLETVLMTIYYPAHYRLGGEAAQDEQQVLQGVMNNPLDTSPNNESGVDTELRDSQKDLRLAEIEEAIGVLRDMVAGNGSVIAQRNLRFKGQKGGSAHGLRTIDWSRWKGRARVDHVTVAGHSFGGATVVDILRRRERFHYVSQGIVYDIWGAGTRLTDDTRPNDRISAPLLAINSEAFTYWRRNFELVESLLGDRKRAVAILLYRNVCSLFLKMTANPRRALDLNINASLEFLNDVLPKDMAMVNRALDDERLLEHPLNPLERIPTELLHKPKDEKWLAARLRIPHEWLYRLSPKLFRYLRRAEEQRQGKEPEPGDEVWLQHRPTTHHGKRREVSGAHQTVERATEAGVNRM